MALNRFVMFVIPDDDVAKFIIQKIKEQKIPVSEIVTDVLDYDIITHADIYAPATLHGEKRIKEIAKKVASREVYRTRRKQLGLKS